MRSSASSRPSPSAHPAPRRRRRHGRRLFCLTVLACCVAGCIAFALSQEPQAAASSAASQPAARSSDAENGLLTAAQAQALLDDPRMVLVNHTHKLADGYTITTKKCGSSTAINKDLQTEAADAFFAMQAAAAKDGVDIRMQSGYRSVDYQTKLYNNKTQYYRDQGCSEADAREYRCLPLAVPARGGVRLYPALPQGGRSRHRDHLRAVALALCGAGKRRPYQPERPVL